MAFMNTALEAVHAHDTCGIYCAIPAKTVKEICYLNIQMSHSQVSLAENLLYSDLQE